MKFVQTSLDRILDHLLFMYNVASCSNLFLASPFFYLYLNPPEVQKRMTIVQAAVFN
jgi:hypothetical protein